MSTFTRREFLAAGGLAAGLVLLQPERSVLAQGCAATRYNLASAQGRKMLQIYADSVRRMTNMILYPESSPLSWMFQWYTHMVRGDRAKAAELARVFPLGGNPMALANEMWNTCQAHLGQPEQNFLPWHRMGLGFFEQIIRAVSGEACFTLPYWDYTNSAQQALPKEFRRRTHVRWSALYQDERYAEINGGTPLPQGRTGLQLNLDCMKSGSYDPFNGDAGFCANIDSMVHGAAHLDIGTQLGMATVPWAARDPIFWIHHCNIDRIWASWNRAGGRNPADTAFLDRAFVFADGSGARVQPRIRDVLSVPSTAYDAWAARPAGGLPFQQAAGAGAATSAATAAALESNDIGEDGDIRLGDEAVTVTLAAGPGAGRSSVAEPAPGAGAATQAILSVEGRTASAFIPQGFNVFLHGQRGEALRPGGPAHVGQLHFFGLEAMHGHGPGGADEPSGLEGRDISFVLRSETRALLAKLDPAGVAVTFAPIGPNGAPGAALRRVALVVR